MATKKQTATKPTMENNNVAGGRLGFFEKGAGFFKDGYCRTGPEDSLNHSIAATVTHGFLQSEYGDDGAYRGVKAGQKTCISARHFAQAIREMGPDTGPKVHLYATHDAALKDVDYKDLKRFAATGEAVNQQGRQETHVNPTQGSGAVRESHEFGGDQGTLAPGRGKSQNVKTDAHPGSSGGPRG